MRRREALQQIGLVASLASTGGCAAIIGGRGDGRDDGNRKRSGNLESVRLQPTKGGDDNLVVVVTVRNEGDSKESADLKVSVSLNDALHERTPRITVPGGEEKDIKVPYKIPYEEYRSSKSSISIDLK